MTFSLPGKKFGFDIAFKKSDDKRLKQKSQLLFMNASRVAEKNGAAFLKKYAVLYI